MNEKKRGRGRPVIHGKYATQHLRKELRATQNLLKVALSLPGVLEAYEAHYTARLAAR
jgi:hypothetical protein